MPIGNLRNILNRESPNGSSGQLRVWSPSSRFPKSKVEQKKAAHGEERRQYGQLTISDKPFDSDPENRIIHLGFPFDIDGLHNKVEEILRWS